MVASPMIHIVAGATGAGKTTLARVLADTFGGLRYSIDDWMTGLFWMDSPQPIDFAWTMARIARCETMIRAMASQAAARGVPSILDLGFTTSAHRADFADWAQARGLDVRLHVIDVSAEERWRRVEQRNADRGATYAMPVDRAMFDFMENRWEAPDAAELKRLGGVVHRWTDQPAA